MRITYCWKASFLSFQITLLVSTLLQPLYINPIKAGLCPGGGGGGGGVDLIRALWQLITFKPLTIAIPYLLRYMQNLFFNLIIYFSL